MEITAPNLFIIGAPKCGTTSLFHWLAEHPDICGASEKETYYLLDHDYPMKRDDWPNYLEQGIAGYSRYFTECSSEHYRLEATPDYLYQRTALEFISQLEKKQIIVVLRKPSERIYSLYQFARNNLGTLDFSVSFREFVDAIQTQGGLLEHRPILRMAIAQSRYVDYMEQWLSAIGRESIHVVLFEELVADPLGTVQQLTKALNIDDSFYEHFDFVAYNQSRPVRNKILHRLRGRTHGVLSQYAAKYIPGRIKQAVHALYSLVNQSSRPIEREARDRMVIEELDGCFEPYNRRLEALLNIDLSPWRE
ncbi:sulfotransferase [Mariprofundus sp. KV]|uniref:sulfotransferase family protein n=1 Tax=Mariprofundus sp. KV TaxID=2608715 RepID=UPI0015A1DD2D|nr:sulfotransferase [Mariprofundus sp. KV]NWF35536.1 sulfotransferase [Mariprofundus sp. KV]